MGSNSSKCEAVGGGGGLQLSSCPLIYSFMWNSPMCESLLTSNKLQHMWYCLTSSSSIASRCRPNWDEVATVCCSLCRAYSCLLLAMQGIQLPVTHYAGYTTVCYLLCRVYSCLLLTIQDIQLSVTHYTGYTTVCYSLYRVYSCLLLAIQDIHYTGYILLVKTGYLYPGPALTTLSITVVIFHKMD